MINDLAIFLKENLNKKINVIELDKFINKIIKEEGYEETVENIEGNLFRTTLLTKKGKVITLDYIPNVFNETIMIKNVRLYLENI
ncbi:hypothetical protein ACRTBB_003003 [Clostridium perfringens]|uniref:hypothetical protein n=1 Tax=Clostridium perfringens TaxID=1502 RepID=UPI001C85B3FC|nr:hypothetical protein [Clostridium perfringens]